MRQLLCAGFSALLVFVCAGCNATPKSEADREDLAMRCESTITRFRSEVPSMNRFFEDSAGYAVFPSIGKGGFGIGGAFGRGQLFENGRAVGFVKMTQATIGFQLGGQSFRQIIFFQTEDALRSFKTGNYEFSASVSAVAATAGAAEAANYENGVVVFVAADGGLMYEAAVGGQKFEFEP